MSQPGDSAMHATFKRLGLNPQRTFILLAFSSGLLMLLWAAVMKVDVIVRTEGQIIPAGKSQVVQHLEGGIVKRILVHEGEVVETGQPLIELSGIQTRANLGQVQTKLDALLGREARLIAEQTGAARVSFPKTLNNPNVKRSESAAWQARQTRLAEETEVLRALSRQKKSELTEVVTRQRNLQDELALAEKKHRVISDLKTKNAASELEVLDSQMRIQRLRSQIAEATSSIPRLRAAQAEAKARTGEAEARFRAEASSALTEVREEYAKLKHEIESSVDRLDRNVVKSPVTGLVNRMNVSTIGAVIRPSEVLLEITPSNERIVIETRSNPNDRAHLRKGLPAQVRVGAYDYATYGAFAGHVTQVSADTLEDDRGARFYRVNIEVDVSTLFSQDDQPGVLMPGMMASADIAVGKRTILSYLLSPLMRFRDGAFRAN